MSGKVNINWQNLPIKNEVQESRLWKCMRKALPLPQGKTKARFMQLKGVWAGGPREHAKGAKKKICKTVFFMVPVSLLGLLRIVAHSLLVSSYRNRWCTCTQGCTCVHPHFFSGYLYLGSKV